MMFAQNLTLGDLVSVGWAPQLYTSTVTVGDGGQGRVISVGLDGFFVCFTFCIKSRRVAGRSRKQTEPFTVK